MRMTLLAIIAALATFVACGNEAQSQLGPSGATQSSTFYHVAPMRTISMLAGVVTANGTIQAGRGFTVTHTMTGVYTISTSPFSAFPAITISLNAANADIADVARAKCNKSSCTFTVLTASQNSRKNAYFKLADVSFSFIAVST